VRSGLAIQKRPRTTGPNGRQVAGLDAWRHVSHAIYPAVDGDQRALTQPIPDLGDRYADRKQLCARHYTVRLGADLRQFPIRRPALRSHCHL